MPMVHQHAAARRDLVAQFVYLAEEAGLDTVDRFLTNVVASFNDLALQPMIGAPMTLRHPNRADSCKWRINDFANHAMFSTPHPTACRSCAYGMQCGTGGAC